MMRALYTAATGMQAQQRNIDTTANNLANVNTTGFKKSTIQFQDLLYYNERNAGVPSSISTQVPVGIHVGHGVKFVSTDKVHTQGNMENTGNDLDLSIDGMGFFQILQPNGIIAYTRDGHFNVDGLGRLVTNDGMLMDPEINIPADTSQLQDVPRPGDTMRSVLSASFLDTKNLLESLKLAVNEATNTVKFIGTVVPNYKLGKSKLNKDLKSLDNLDASD